MASLSASSPPCYLVYGRCNPSHSLIFRFPSLPATLGSACPTFRSPAEGGRLKSSASADDSGLIRRPLNFSPSMEDQKEEPFSSGERRRPGRSQRRKDEEWLDWEDVILEDTVPLVSFVRMILHSGKFRCSSHQLTVIWLFANRPTPGEIHLEHQIIKDGDTWYKSGDKLIPEHEKTILERLLPYHPQSQKKIGCGIDYITVGYHPQFENSRCLFIARMDGELEDFSYWKCIKGFIRKNYPLYADSFILRHLRRRRYD